MNVKMYVVDLNVVTMRSVVELVIKQVAPVVLTLKVIHMIYCELDVNLTYQLVLMIHLALIMKLVVDVTMDYAIVHQSVRTFDVASMHTVSVVIMCHRVNVYLVTLVTRYTDVRSHLNIYAMETMNVKAIKNVYSPKMVFVIVLMFASTSSVQVVQRAVQRIIKLHVSV